MLGLYGLKTNYVMAILLESIDISGLIKDAQLDWSGVRAVVETSLDGTPLIWEDTIAGKPVDFFGGEDWGWLDRTTLESLLALATVPGASYTLDEEGAETQVRFRSEDPPVVSGEPNIGRDVQDPFDSYKNVRIKLMEI